MDTEPVQNVLGKYFDLQVISSTNWGYPARNLIIAHLISPQSNTTMDPRVGERMEETSHNNINVSKNAGVNIATHNGNMIN